MCLHAERTKFFTNLLDLLFNFIFVSNYAKMIRSHTRTDLLWKYRLYRLSDQSKAIISGSKSIFFIIRSEILNVEIHKGYIISDRRVIQNILSQNSKTSECR